MRRAEARMAQGLEGLERVGEWRLKGAGPERARGAGLGAEGRLHSGLAEQTHAFMLLPRFS